MSRKVYNFNYSLKDSQGNVLDSSTEGPLAFLEGAGQIIPALEAQILTMTAGAKKNVKLNAVDAYGVSDPSMMIDVPAEELAHLKLEVGAMLQMDVGDQVRVVRVAKINDQSVTLDGNHPLAGQDLEFDVELVEARLATSEELAHGHPHGPGGHSH